MYKKYNKYKAIKTKIDNITFDSKKEARRYTELKQMQKIGVIKELQCQPRIPLVVNGKQIGHYVGDFKYLDKLKTETLLAYGVYQIEADGLQLFEYVKGDRNSIMGLPMKDIINYINQYNK